MILVSAYFKKMYFVSFLDLQTDTLDGHIHLLIDNSPAILRWKDYVVQEDGDIVTFVDEFAHAYDYITTDTPQGAGNMTRRDLTYACIRSFAHTYSKIKYRCAKFGRALSGKERT